jgi:fatty-acyl-CoA synthase
VAAFLTGRLARYKLPRRVVHLEALPRTALGKVQKPLLIDKLLLNM